jgi:hypothetical protein
LCGPCSWCPAARRRRRRRRRRPAWPPSPPPLPVLGGSRTPDASPSASARACLEGGGRRGTHGWNMGQIKWCVGPYCVVPAHMFVIGVQAVGHPPLPSPPSPPPGSSAAPALESKKKKKRGAQGESRFYNIYLVCLPFHSFIIPSHRSYVLMIVIHYKKLRRYYYCYTAQTVGGLRAPSLAQTAANFQCSNFARQWTCQLIFQVSLCQLGIRRRPVI